MALVTQDDGKTPKAAQGKQLGDAVKTFKEGAEEALKASLHMWYLSNYSRMGSYVDQLHEIAAVHPAAPGRWGHRQTVFTYENLAILVVAFNNEKYAINDYLPNARDLTIEAFLASLRKSCNRIPDREDFWCLFHWHGLFDAWTRAMASGDEKTLRKLTQSILKRADKDLRMDVVMRRSRADRVGKGGLQRIRDYTDLKSLLSDSGEAWIKLVIGLKVTGEAARRVLTPASAGGR